MLQGASALPAKHHARYRAGTNQQQWHRQQAEQPLQAAQQHRAASRLYPPLLRCQASSTPAACAPLAAAGATASAPIAPLQACAYSLLCRSAMP